MDVELRQALRALQRAVGAEEIAYLELFYLQIREYLQALKLPLHFGGVSHGGGSYPDLKRLIPEARYSQNISSQQITFLYHSDLDIRPSEEILKICCSHSSWSSWFYLTSYYQTFVSKQPGSYVWNLVLSDSGPREEPARDGTTYHQRLQGILDRWDYFVIVCHLRPKYPSEKSGLWYNWTAEFSLVGYSQEINRNTTALT